MTVMAQSKKPVARLGLRTIPIGPVPVLFAYLYAG